MKTTQQNRSKIWIFLLAIAMLAALFGMWSQFNLKSEHDIDKLDLDVATIFPQPRLIQPFELKGADDKPFTQENLKGQYSLVFFGFTHCPALCPTTLSTLNQSYQMLQDRKVKSLPQIVFISVDPERDTPAVIKTYLSSFNKAFVGATGSKKELDELTQEMSVLYTKVLEPGKAEQYTIDHSGTLVLINPKGQVQGVFTLPHDAQKIAHDLEKIERTV